MTDPTLRRTVPDTTHFKYLAWRSARVKSFLNGGFDDALTELVINDGCILGGEGDKYEGRRVYIF